MSLRVFLFHVLYRKKWLAVFALFVATFLFASCSAQLYVNHSNQVEHSSGNKSVANTSSSTDKNNFVNDLINQQKLGKCAQEILIISGLSPVKDTYPELVSYIQNIKYDPTAALRDQRQKELTTPITQYIQSVVSKKRIEKGKKVSVVYSQYLEHLEIKYQIPKEVIVAIWGIESSYGSQKGKHKILDSLLNLYCFATKQSRKNLSLKEFQNLIKLHKEGSIDATNVKGSWAGAIGHTQMLPSSIRMYAIDGNNDGKIDLVQSIYDALASTANYLKVHGWKNNTRVILQVDIPKNRLFSTIGDYYVPKKLEKWKNLVLFRNITDETLQASEKYFLSIPTGDENHSFLLSENFDVIKKYNHSFKYAFAVCVLAESISQQGDFFDIHSWEKEQFISKEDIEFVQRKLQSLGLYHKKIDGILGKATEKAIINYKIVHQILGSDGNLNHRLLEMLKQ